MSLTVKTDDVTKGRKDVDPHGRFRGEWVKIPMTSYFPANYKVKCRKIEIFRIESLHFYPYQFRIGSYIKVIVLIKQTK